MKPARFLCLALMIEHISKAMDVMHYLLVIRANYKKIAILIIIQDSFFFKQIALIFSLIRTSFWLGILNLKSTKHLKKL